MKVWVTGHKGMLGSEVVGALERLGYEALTTSLDISAPLEVEEALDLGRPDTVINCAGKLKSADPLDMVRANALGPHVLKQACERYNIRLIHISTDCVFSGLPDARRESYQVGDQPDPVDLYGRTKLVGESIVDSNVLVVRTSFVGMSGGLLYWLRQNQGKEVEGWDWAYWNGTSVPVLAEWLAGEADNGLTGLVQVASAEKVSKFWLLNELSNLLGLGVTVKPVNEPRIDRALAPTIPGLPPLREALERLVA